MTKTTKREKLNYYEDADVIAFMEEHSKQKTMWIRKATRLLMKLELKSLSTGKSLRV